MSAANTNAVSAPAILTPSPRIMRRVGATRDAFRDADLNPSEASIAWAPRVLPLYSFPFVTRAPGQPHEYHESVPAGSAVAIVRPGYEAHPLGIATDVYRPVNHAETAAEVVESTRGVCTPEAAMIDGHGYHVVHAFRLDTVASESINIAIEVQQALGGEPRGLPLVSRLTLVHDHTGGGALRASVVAYLGADVVLGSRNFTRKLHVGAGAKDAGVGDRARWAAVVDKMVQTAALQQEALAATVRAASQTLMTEEHAAVFERAGVRVEREKPAREGEPGRIVPVTALDVVVAHHKSRRGRITWGVWSRRLEGDALACLETITGVELPRQLFRRGSL